MKPTRFYLGNDADPEGFARHLVKHEIADGATVFPTLGLWRDPNTGEVHDEDGAMVEVFGLSQAAENVIRDFTVPSWLRQHDELSALVQWSDGSTDLVWRETVQ